MLSEHWAVRTLIAEPAFSAASTFGYGGSPSTDSSDAFSTQIWILTASPVLMKLGWHGTCPGQMKGGRDAAAEQTDSDMRLRGRGLSSSSRACVALFDGVATAERLKNQSISKISGRATADTSFCGEFS